MDAPTSYIQFTRDFPDFESITVRCPPQAIWRLEGLVRRLVDEGPMELRRVRMALGSLGRETIGLAIQAGKDLGLFAEQDGQLHPLVVSFCWDRNHRRFVVVRASSRPQGPPQDDLFWGSSDQ